MKGTGLWTLLRSRKEGDRGIESSRGTAQKMYTIHSPASTEREGRHDGIKSDTVRSEFGDVPRRVDQSHCGEKVG